MKIIVFRLRILIPILIFLAGCSTEGEIRIINRTDQNLYFTVENNDYILEGSSTSDPSFTLSIDTGRKLLMLGTAEKEVELYLEGETFMMQLADAGGLPTGVFYTDTTVLVKADKTTNIYCDPTHAGVKLINNSTQNVVEFTYSTGESDSLKSLISAPILVGDTFWARLKASTVYDSISYSFQIEYQDGSFDNSHQNIDDLSAGKQLLIILP
jgi:hypothetical protein